MAANGQFLTIAREYSLAGLSPIAVRVDGSKAPIETGWQKIFAADSYLTRQFGNRKRAAIGILCGAASGGLEVLDIDRAELYELVVECIEAESPGLMERLPIVRTGSGAFHVYFRHTVRNASGNPPGGTKLARRENPSTGKVETLVETRGHGHQVVAPGSHVDVHPAKRPYEHIAGPPLTETPNITAEEREIILKAARSFDQMPHTVQVDQDQSPRERPPEGRNLPGDAYDRTGPKWSEILEPKGWAFVKKCGESERWARPGKEGDGCSATTNYDGHDLLTVFSENADPFEVWADPPQCERRQHYSKFSAYALLYHNGNFGEASDYLEAQGYGTKKDEADYSSFPCLDGGRTATASERKADQAQYGDRLRALKNDSPPNGDTPKAGGTKRPKIEWEQPADLEMASVPDWPAEGVMPEELHEFVAALAEETQTPQPRKSSAFSARRTRSRSTFLPPSSRRRLIARAPFCAR